jgi:hypothetical protein
MVTTSGIFTAFRYKDLVGAELHACTAVDAKDGFPAGRIEVDCADYARINAFAAGIA